MPNDNELIDQQFEDDLDNPDYEDNPDIEGFEGEYVDITDPHNLDNDSYSGSQEEEQDVIDTLLKEKGIEDKTKIKYEDEDGNIQDVDWDSLDKEDLVNILRTGEGPYIDLQEAILLNSIRNSGLSPREYMQTVQRLTIDNFIKNSQRDTMQYRVDQYTDDELFVADLVSKIGEDNITPEEANEKLTQAKDNPTLFQKQINALREEYKNLEWEVQQQEEAEAAEQRAAENKVFSDRVVDEINNLTQFSGYEIDLSDDEKQEVYDFITTSDAAGRNHFAKALADPKTLVKVAWLALNGEQILQDTTDYYKKLVSAAKKEGYERGKAEALGRRLKNRLAIGNPNSRQPVDDEDIDF